VIPSELMIQERIQEHEREADHMRLVHLAVTEENLVERLRRYGAALFGGDHSNNKPSEHKN
jgi:hypothetical protein